MTRLSAKPDRSDPSSAQREVACTHCGLPVPRGLIESDSDEQFCCEGCRAVYHTLLGCGLEDYYRLREAVGADAQPARISSQRFEEFDDTAFTDLYCQRVASGLQSVELYLENVHCAACVWLVEKLPRLLPGVAEARLNIRQQIVRILWNDHEVDLSRIARQLAALGYPPHPVRGAAARGLRRMEDRRFLIRIAIAGAIAGNVMLIAFALYGGMFHSIEPKYLTLFRWVSLGLSAIALAWPGRVFFRGALGALRARRMHMDVPIALGLSAAAAWSVFNTIRGAGEVYYESLTVLIFLLLVGRWIQTRQQRRSNDAIELLFSITPTTARLIDGDDIRIVPIEALQPKQLVEVRAGDSIPVDGIVIDGRSELDLSLLTGESRPVGVEKGAAVNAGATNLASTLRVRVETTGQATRIGKLMRMVEECARRDAPVVHLADRVASFFVTAVVVLAFLTALIWWRIDPQRAAANAISLLIVTCPCALGLATPLAIVAGVARAAHRGILIKGGEVVELLRKTGVILLDKTGTLTEGRVAVVEWHGDELLKSPAAALEAHSAHPIARAIVDSYRDDAAGLLATDVIESPGECISGMLDETAYVIGSRAALEKREIQFAEWAEQAEREMVGRAISPVFIAADGEVKAVGGMGDPIKPDAAAAIAQLRDQGFQVRIVSGDHPEVVRAVASEVGVEPEHARGGVTPEEKLRIVEDERNRSNVIMVGDGVNDAAALAAATVGVAVHGGAEASLAAADVYLTHAGLQPLNELIHGSRRTYGVIRRNLIVSLAYNVIGAGLAMGGLINPLIAAILMPVSSLTVLMLSYRSRTFEDKACP